MKKIVVGNWLSLATVVLLIALVVVALGYKKETVKTADGGETSTTGFYGMRIKTRPNPDVK